ncbi:Formylmethanofuran--tetrahydromethanopterin N-formyltransferase [hydrothermal vent metagenome]|uniref:Formylmethanofuran--tetrahydromethanopterin N-formyltransferase n=1 Tax=hydrothermal vent metagenome TaxID=652676 RepID=A0A3B1BDS8_9ZZZZ
MRVMELNGVIIDNTHSEAFAMYYARALVTAIDHHWLDAAVRQATGFATSIIGCDVEAGREIFTLGTPDEKLGAYLLFFGRHKEGLAKSLVKRFGQTILTCPTTNLYNGAKDGDPADIGAKLRYFGDGIEEKVEREGRTFWQIPVSEGTFTVEEKFNINEGVAGGAFIVMARTEAFGLYAARKAVEAIEAMEGVITPFPGGVCRAASQMQGRYKFMKASSNRSFLPPSGKRTPGAKMHPEGVTALEIVIDGVDEESVRQAMKAGIEAACENPGVVMISAANFGGRLGNVKIPLIETLEQEP